jgi:hypothetical protein
MVETTTCNALGSCHAMNLSASDELLPHLLRLLPQAGIAVRWEEINEMVIGRRLQWAVEHSAILSSYEQLAPLEKVMRFIYLDHLHIRLEDLDVMMENGRRLVIRCRNWCPYLEACNRLAIDTRVVCRRINHDCFVLLAQFIDPRLSYTRNYELLRPHGSYCEETWELTQA